MLRPLLQKLAARYNYDLRKIETGPRQIAELDRRYSQIDSTREIVFVGTIDQPGFQHGKKLTRNYFLPHACELAAEQGIKTHLVPDPMVLPGLLRRLKRPLFVLVYHEQRSDRAFLEHVTLMLERCHAEALIVNHPERCLVLADKKQQNALFAAHGVPMPAMLTADVADQVVFSNENARSQALTQLLQPGKELDPARYNTAFVDTVHHFDGDDYYVALRVLGVGTDCVAAYVRARPVADGDASVHAKDTPLNPALLNDLDARLVQPNMDQIRRICAGIGELVGLSCYACDILPCRNSGRLIVCEACVKFDDDAIRERLLPIADQTPAYADFVAGEDCRNIMRSLIRQAEASGWLP